MASTFSLKQYYVAFLPHVWELACGSACLPPDRRIRTGERSFDEGPSHPP